MGNVIKPLWGQMYITDYIGNVKYQISPLSFFQVNPVQTEKLYKLALEYSGLNDVSCGNPSDKVVSVAFAELQELLKDYPVEHVEFDEHGRYDVDKYPEFHDWVINGWYK